MILDLTRNFYTGHQKHEQQIKMSKLDFIKIKNFSVSKATINKK